MQQYLTLLTGPEFLIEISGDLATISYFEGIFLYSKRATQKQI